MLDVEAWEQPLLILKPKRDYEISFSQNKLNSYYIKLIMYSVHNQRNIVRITYFPVDLFASLLEDSGKEYNPRITPNQKTIDGGIHDEALADCAVETKSFCCQIKRKGPRNRLYFL